ncbi:terminase small subunit [Mycobacterium phage Antsirabe]|uniref:Terminase small subunit n=1 Tax=Mycobacterium phage Antsirabe TaxID=2575610 RepID=A0A5J6TH11_9CAUD|nr:terminase small subunit [Mycobacterium phage Antsirabe]QFG09955.1 hypothetical protein PBI_ANTSIRABE_1 [Mycobacterium phage Antsirabe]
MAGKPPLRAVKDGEAAPTPPRKRAPAKRARTMAQAAKLSKKTFLEAVRDKLAAQMDDPRSHPRDVIAAATKVLEVQAQIDALNPKKAAPVAPKTAIADTPNESWDADAI